MMKLLAAGLVLPLVASITFADSAPTTRPRELSDEQLFDLVQRQTFRYFWEGAHPSGMALVRSRDGNGHETPDCVSTGGTGWELMALLVGAERHWISRADAVDRISKVLDFLERAPKYHGAFSHWYNGKTGDTWPFNATDDGADLVETSFLSAGLIAAKQYFDADTPREATIRQRMTKLWEGVDWQFFTRGQNVLYWHWSPNSAWSKNMAIRGWNECLITYVLAASSPTHGVKADVYHEGWARDGKMVQAGRKFYGIELTMGRDLGGPLFQAQYSFMALDPRKLHDRYAEYWTHCVNHTLINRAYCIDNPKKFPGYSENCWGLTSSHNPEGYKAHNPTRDLGVISPTAALSSFPYTPKYSMQAMKHFYFDRGDKLWSEYGFYDAFSDKDNWVSKGHLANDQGPIVVMMENHRSGLLWRYFMRDADVQKGLTKLGFQWD